MNKVRLKYVFLLIFAFLFINLFSISVTKINAEEPALNLSNAYRGEIRNYWALVNYGEDFVGEESVTIFLDPEAISNQDIHYIQINECDQNGDIITTYFKRGEDSRFASRFSYTFIDGTYGSKRLTMFLLEDLLNEPTSIIERINITRLERVRNIKNLTSEDFLLTQEVEEDTPDPYKIYVDIVEYSCDYKIKNVIYSYKNLDGTEIKGNAIPDTSVGAPCNRYYFIVNQNGTYHVSIEDYFGYKQPKEGDELSITIDNFVENEFKIVVDYDTALTRFDIPVYVSVVDYKDDPYDGNLIASLTYEYNGTSESIKNIGVFMAKENGLYTITCRNTDGKEVFSQIYITNIDREAPVVFVTSTININSSDVENIPYVFDPFAHVLATDNASLGDKLIITPTYYHVSGDDPSCLVNVGNELSEDFFRYLYGVNDVCINFEVLDEAGNSRSARTKVIVNDNTKPTIAASIKKITIEYGNNMPESEEELKRLFGLTVDDNSRLFDITRPISITSDFSQVNLEELNTYPVYISAVDWYGNVGDPITLAVTITQKILRIKADPDQYMVYGEPFKEITYKCNGNPCEEEILPVDWPKLTGKLYISSGAKYVGTYPISSSLTINSKKYAIELDATGLGVYTIKPRTFKIVASSYSIEYKDPEPILTWYMDTNVCNADLSTKYTSFDEINYSCTFVDGDSFGGGAYQLEERDGKVIYAGGIKREEGITVKFDAGGNVIYYKILVGDLKVNEVLNGGRDNYVLDFYGDYEGFLDTGFSRFYIYPKYVEVTLKDAYKIYGETDPNPIYTDENKDKMFTDDLGASKGNMQYEFSCRVFTENHYLYGKPTSECQEEIQLVINRQNGEDVGRYLIIGRSDNVNYEVMFNEFHESGAKESAYLTIIKRKINMKMEGNNGDGKYTIYYEDPLPEVNVQIEESDSGYEGLAKGSYLNINNAIEIEFEDWVVYGEPPITFVDDDGNNISVSNGIYDVYVPGVGVYKIIPGNVTIYNLNGDNVLHNYEVIFDPGELTVIARQIYIKVVEGLTKTYGEYDPVFNNQYIIDNYGEDSNYVVDGSGRYILQIVNTVNNSDIIDSENYEPFDKDKLVYHLKRSNIRRGQTEVDFRVGEMVGEYLVSCDRFENSTNYLIDIYQEYYFKIERRVVTVNINSNVIEFNYANVVPKFSYSYSNSAFTDSMVGQPGVDSFAGSYRNNGEYRLNMGDMTMLSNAPVISSVENIWYINNYSTGISLDRVPSLDNSLINVKNGKYYIINSVDNSIIETSISVKEYDVMWNYSFIVNPNGDAYLKVIARNVIIVPDDNLSKRYGDQDPMLTFVVKHAGDEQVEAILDWTDFTGTISRESGEKPEYKDGTFNGLYELTLGSLAPAQKGDGYNFNIVNFESNHYFKITRRSLIVRHAASDESNTVKAYYGDDINALVKGYKLVEGSEAVDDTLCTLEMVNGLEVCDKIFDNITGEIATEPENPENVGTYKIVNKSLRVVRAKNPLIDVSKYYDLTFIEATLLIEPKIIYITPLENQSKIYGEDNIGGDCGIKYTYSPLELVKATDTFSGCLQRETKTLADGTVTSEAAGEYRIGLGTLKINTNYQLILNGSVMYRVDKRPITITAKVIGENVSKSNNLQVYTMTYGDTYELGYDIGGMGIVDKASLGIHDYIVNNVELDPSYDGVGIYLVVQGKLNVTNANNYDLTYIRAQFNVNKRVIKIKPATLSKIYGDSDPLTFPFEFVGEEVPYTGQLARFGGENVGEYKIIQGTLSVGDNYDIQIEDTYFEIVQRRVYVFADDKSKLYKDADPEFTYTYIVDGDFTLDVPFTGILDRLNKESEDVGVYPIVQNTLNLNANYDIEYEGANFTIYYADFTSIEIYSLTNNKYQTQGEESEVQVYARFNLGADESKLSEVSWSILKNNSMDISFEKDANNIVKFTPSGSMGTYVITASYLGLSATYEVIVRTNNISSIYISLSTGNVNQTLGLESEVVYMADIHLYEELDEEVNIEWYVGDKLVCEKVLGEVNNYCAFIPTIGVGTHKVYAKIGVVVSNELDLTIKDNAAPKITLVDQDVIYYIEAFQNRTANSIKYIEPGYTAIDDVDGDITRKVVVKGVDSIDYYKTGTYYIVYEVVDNHGHVANNFRTVIIQDTIAPTITLNRPELSELILEYGEPYTEFGATAKDAYDDYYGYGLHVYIDSNLNVNKIGTYEIVYFAVDSNGLRGQATRIVHIRDSVKPVITLIGDQTIYVEYKDVYKDLGAWFEDNYDGRYRIYATSTIFIPEGQEESQEVSSVDTSLLGIYRLTYYQTDSSGNAPEEVVVRTVIVRDSLPPVITLLGSNPYILRYGTKYVEPGYKVIDNYDGDITNNSNLVTVVEIIGDTLGTYYVYYNAKDTHNNISSEVKREVIVLDLISPIIYFTDRCPQHMTIEVFSEFDSRCNLPGAENGYTVFDDYLPDLEVIQDWVKVTGSIDNTVVGTYEIKYDVSDRSGNNAITLTRYVNVVDTTPPTIELLPNEDGDIDFYVEVFNEYIEPGWIVHDEYDDYHNLPINVTVTHNINITKLNTYTVTYVAIDTNGNRSEPVYRDITVRDTVPPEVTLIGDSEIILERGTPYAEYGATAKDNYDGIINTITISGQPTGMKLGNYDVKYCAKDSSGNEGCTIRIVKVVDTIAPVVLGVEDGMYYRAPLYIYYAPLTGTDEILTGKLNNELITSPWYVYKEDKYHLVVKDDAGNQTVVDFTIDMTPPTLYGANDGEYLNHPVTIYSDEELRSITYKVNNGGYITTTDQTILFDLEGQYSVYATDKAGNTSSAITFVIDMTPPIYTLEGVLNGGITSGEVSLVTELDVVVSVNNKYIPTNYKFTENGYYKVTIRDIAGNDVFLQFVINNNPTVMINEKSVTFITQNNAIGTFVAKANSSYPKGSGFIYAKPLVDGTFEYISGKLFSDEEYSKLINGEDISFEVPNVDDDEMVVAFIVTLDELNKFTTQTVEGDDDSAIVYAVIAMVAALIGGGAFYFFVIAKRKKEEEEEEDEEIIDEDTYY